MRKSKEPSTLLEKTFLSLVALIGASGMVAQIVLLRELMIAFKGNELSIGIILANWLLLEAAGSYLLGRTIESRKRKLRLFVLLNMILTLSFPAAIHFVRAFKGAFGLNPGEGVGIMQMLILSFTVLLPVSVCHGALFTFACKIHSEMRRSASPSAGLVYTLEVLGTALGGLIFTYLLLPFLDPMQIAFSLAALNAALGIPLMLQLASIRRLTVLLVFLNSAVLCISGYLLLSGHAADMNRSSAESAWPNQNILYFGNSPYGNVVVTKMEEQHTLFSDGVPVITIPTPDIALVEDFAHLPLLFHGRPDKVLIISGGAGGIIREIGKHKVKEIHYTEIDPLILEALNRFSPPQISEEWRNPGVTVYQDDGRDHLRKTEGRYDIVLIGVSDPADLQTNRFFTEEFFTLVRERLAEGGIMMVSLPGSTAYLSEEQRRLNACIWKTLLEVFEFVRVIPGDLNFFLASESPDITSLGAEDLARRLDERKIQGRLINPSYIDYRLQEMKRKRLLDFIRDTNVKLNSDNRPAAVFYSLGLWSSKFSPHIQKILRSFEGLSLPVLLFPCAAAALLLAAFGRFAHRLPGRSAIPFVVFSSGFCGMVFDLIVVFGFQILYGSLYFRVGILITSFMIGTGLGSSIITMSVEKIKKSGTLLLILETGLVIFSGLLLVLFLEVIPLFKTREIPSAFEFVFYITGFAGGFLIGAEFPLAVKIHLGTGTVFSRSVGFLNAADLAGGWLGGIFGGIILIPVLGIGGTSILLIVIKLTAIAVYFMYSRPSFTAQQGASTNR